MAEKKQKKVQVVTPVGRAAYAWVHKPDTGHKFSNGKFKITLVLDGDTDLTALKKQIVEFALEAYPDVDPDDIRLPWKDGDDHKNEEFHGKILLNASSKFKPKIVDGKRKALKKGVRCMSGDDVRLVVNLFAYSKVEKVRVGKKTVDETTYGVSLQMNVVQLIRKNAGGAGGLDMLDDVEDGFDQDDWEDDYEDDDTDGYESDDEDNDDDDADF